MSAADHQAFLDALRASIKAGLASPDAKQFIASAVREVYGEVPAALTREFFDVSNARRAGRKQLPEEQRAQNAECRAQIRAAYLLAEEEIGWQDARSWINANYRLFSEQRDLPPETIKSVTGKAPNGTVRARANQLLSDQNFRSDFMARFEADGESNCDQR